MSLTSNKKCQINIGVVIARNQPQAADLLVEGAERVHFSKGETLAMCFRVQLLKCRFCNVFSSPRTFASRGYFPSSTGIYTTFDAHCMACAGKWV